MFHVSTFPVDLPHAILDVLPNPVFVKSTDGRFVWVNPAFETFFGVDRDAVLGTMDAGLPMRRSDADTASDARVLASGTPEESQQSVFTANGDARTVSLHKSRMVLPDGTALLVGTMQDITDATRAQAAMRDERAELEQQAAHLADLVNTDALTGTLTRRALSDQLQTLGRGAYGVLMLDIDHFKAINDTYGHAVGDRALTHFCDTMRRHLRSNDVFARIGGEEFVVIVPGLCAEKLRNVGERLVNALRAAPLDLEEGPLAMTVSAGGASVMHPGADTIGTFEAALKDADDTLYRAKNDGRDQVIIA